MEKCIFPLSHEINSAHKWYGESSGFNWSVRVRELRRQLVLLRPFLRHCGSPVRSRSLRILRSRKGGSIRRSPIRNRIRRIRRRRAVRSQGNRVPPTERRRYFPEQSWSQSAPPPAESASQMETNEKQIQSFKSERATYHCKTSHFDCFGGSCSLAEQQETSGCWSPRIRSILYKNWTEKVPEIEALILVHLLFSVTNCVVWSAGKPQANNGYIAVQSSVEISLNRSSILALLIYYENVIEYISIPGLI